MQKVERYAKGMERYKKPTAKWKLNLQVKNKFGKLIWKFGKPMLLDK